MFSTFEKLLLTQLSIIDRMARGRTRNRKWGGDSYHMQLFKNTCKHLIFVLFSNNRW